MEQYRIYSTTDGKYVGKIFTINESTNTIDIPGEDISPEHQVYAIIQRTPNRIKISNVNYTILGKLI
jgi:hypothetical protein